LIKVVLAIMVLVVLTVTSACNQDGVAPTIESSTVFIRPTMTPIPDLKSSSTFSVGLTYGNVSGNKYFPGSANIRDGAEPTAYQFEINSARWVIGSMGPRGEIVWSMVGDHGSNGVFRTAADGELVPTGAIYGSQLDELVPSMLLVGELTTDGNDPGAVRFEDIHADGRNHLLLGVRFEEFGDQTAITYRGLSTLYSLDVLPDAVTVIDGAVNLYSYAEPTHRYPHGALGDKTEWAALNAIPLSSENRKLRQHILQGDEVFEALFPLVADVNGDEVQEIVTTVSDPASGARLVVFDYDENGLSVIAESDPVGTGFRWLHQIAVAPFGPNGEIEIAVVETPHVGGIAKFYRLVDGRLELVASKAGGYMSHVNGSRNLDQAVAGDFDGDGAVELIVPSRYQKSLIALRRIGDSVEEVWEL